MTTLALALPAAALTKRSIPAARSYGLLPLMVAARSPEGRATAPIRITWAPPTPPVGFSVASAVALAAGRVLAPESRMGARIGGAISTAEAIAAGQLELGASTTAAGCVPGAADGYTASATAAASAAGVGARTRVVFLVATSG